MNGDVLSRKFEPHEISVYERTWEGRDGKQKSVSLYYVEVASIIERLNEAFDYEWSFEIKSHMVMQDESTVVFGRMTAGGVFKDAVGSAKAGQGDEGESNSLKGAVGDCIRLCAKQFGLGVHLWQKQKTTQKASSKPAATAQPAADTTATQERQPGEDGDVFTPATEGDKRMLSFLKKKHPNWSDTVDSLLAQAQAGALSTEQAQAAIESIKKGG